MDNAKDDRYYLSKIIDNASFVIEHTQKLSPDQFAADDVLIDSVMFRLVQISESASKLTADFKQKNNRIDWQAINGLRNRIVHDYGRVDLSIIYQTIREDLPRLKEYLLGVK